MGTTPPSLNADRLSRQLFKNSGLMVVSRCFSMVALLVTVPVILATLGKDGYGVWESLLAITGIAMVLQSVVSGTILWQISTSYGVGNHLQTRRLVRIGIGTTLWMLALFAPLAWWSGETFTTSLQVPLRWCDDIRWIFPALVGVLLLGGINQSLLSVLSGYQKSGIASLIQSAGLLATNVIAASILLLGGGLEAMFLGYLVGFAVMFAVAYPCACSCCGRIRLLPAWPSRKEWSRLAPYAGLLLLSNLTFIFSDHTDKLILASFDSQTATGYFGMAQRLTALVLQACMVFYLPFTAAVGALHARNDWAGIRNLYVKLGMWMGAIAGLVGFLVSTLRTPLFMLWLGRDQPEAHGFLALLLLGGTSAVIFSGAGVALAKGIGRPGLETTYTMLTLALILFSKPLLMIVGGPFGAVASSAVSWSIGAFFLLLILHRQIDLPHQAMRQAIGFFLVTLILSGIGWWATSDLEQTLGNDTNRWGAGLFLLIAVPLLTIGYLGILTATRLIQVSEIGKLIPRRLHKHFGRRHEYENAYSDLPA